MAVSEGICSSTAQERTQTIRKLNDRFRRTFEGGRVVVTHGVQLLGPCAVLVILQAVAKYRDFRRANDPYGEHDFGGFEWRDQTIFWKIDYFDRNMEAGSPDPADDEATSRVLTIMLASEY
jgi:hypothetical protein